MERVDTALLARTSLREEHFHRYHIASQLCQGRVVDCACGIGYGSEFLLSQSKVDSYLGLDPSEASVAYAAEHYASPKAQFAVGTLEENRCAPDSADSFVMLETLEHIVDPGPALSSIATRLSQDGVLIGSVPSAGYEDLCTSVYGRNPYHVQKFTAHSLKEVLKEHFEAVALFSISFEVGTLLVRLDEGPAAQAGSHIDDSRWVGAQGTRSLMFLAGNREALEARLQNEQAAQNFYPAALKATVDEEESEAVRAALQQTEAIAAERWDIMQDYDKTIIDRYEMIAARDSMVAFAEKRRSENKDMSRADQEVIQRRLDAAISTKGAPFSDLAFSLYVFIERLFLRACQNQTRDIYFLSREGWDLKEMFELYHRTMAPGVPITAHYLEASRRSSFLPSLGPLEAETFEVLFRQYRAMSLEAFLSSLGLDARIAEISAAMGLDEVGLGQKHADLPTDPVFRQLLDLPLFQTIYERERQSRGTALEHYVAGFTDGVLPNELVLVDVGWKGSIQDNLYRWFRAQKGPGTAIHGYYIGLNAFRQPEQNNQKTGLLFDTWPDPSAGFRIFNENRSLFEILLPARHGGPLSYEMKPNGTAQVRHEPYMEQELIDTHVQPIAAEILTKFKLILDHQVEAPLPDQSLFNLACRRHARMVFEPTQAEIEWVCAVHHRENFGVFEESRLGASVSQSSILERVRFTARIIRYRRFGEAGFWPYLTLKQRAVRGLSTVYRILRKWQESEI